jgi:hypothetical protein
LPPLLFSWLILMSVFEAGAGLIREFLVITLLWTRELACTRFATSC